MRESHKLRSRRHQHQLQVTSSAARMISLGAAQLNCWHCELRNSRAPASPRTRRESKSSRFTRSTRSSSRSLWPTMDTTSQSTPWLRKKSFASTEDLHSNLCLRASLRFSMHGYLFRLSILLLCYQNISTYVCLLLDSRGLSVLGGRCQAQDIVPRTGPHPSPFSGFLQLVKLSSGPCSSRRILAESPMSMFIRVMEAWPAL